MKVAVNHVSRLANNAIHRAGGRCIYDATNSLVIVEFPTNTTVQSYVGTSEVQDSCVSLDDTEELLRFHRAWSIEESSLVLVNEEVNEE